MNVSTEFSREKVEGERMEDVRKWTVTYTKHLKQKRKVYHDGFLHFFPNNKVVLYDECEQMLECKFLTKGEVVKSGEALTFGSCLVDVGDPESSSSCILLSNVKTEGDPRTPEKTRFPHQEKFRNSFASREPTRAVRRTTGMSLSPSQKIIREFKKNEEVKYNVQQSPKSTTASSHKEWEVLYTTHITQKAKKYHDGFIRLIICGSQSRQVALYDSSRDQIDKRFLKKDEVISSGESLKFDAHLVDIGDAVGNKDNIAEVQAQENKKCKTEQPDRVQQLHNSSKENLMFKSQRCKLPAQRNHVRAGSAVAIGQARHDASSKCRDSKSGSLAVDQVKQTKTAPSHMPIRDANCILSFLKKPIALDKDSAAEKSADMKCLSETQEVVQNDNNSQVIEGAQQTDPHQKEITEKHHCNNTTTEGRMRTGFKGDHPQSEAADDNSAATPVNPDSRSTTEGPGTMPGIVSESPNKTLPLIGSGSTNELQASVDHGQTPPQQHARGIDFMDSLPSQSCETTTNQQLSAKLPSADSSTEKPAASTKPRRLYSGFARMRMIKTSPIVSSSETTIECPSFDLGIEF